jgi:threonine aldolase
MNFTSDNTYGATPEILAAVTAAAAGAVPSYGDDPQTGALGATMSQLFGREVAVYPVVTGTAANALALSTLCPPHGAVLCHAEAHVAVDECGAPEFYSHGAKLVPIEGANGKLTPDAIEAALKHFQIGVVHHAQPAVISITQASEFGTVYTRDEISEIAGVAKKHKLKLHMDGARFANALARLGCAPADVTWRLGVDALSFGATKNGALCAEAVVFFDRGDVRDFEYRRKKGGHLLSKMRFVSAQLAAYLEDDRWLKTAARANGLAERMAQGLARVEGAEIAYPVEANAIFAYVPDAVVKRLRKGGARFYDWRPPANGRTLIRLVLSFATPEEDVDRFLEIAGS